jgi:4-alpha-glucanotransferase
MTLKKNVLRWLVCAVGAATLAGAGLVPAAQAATTVASHGEVPRFERSSGILVHVTALPSKFGIGDLGPESYRFVNLLQKLGQSYWQVLPIGASDYLGSPYSSSSAFAGNANLISPELLVREGLLAPADLQTNVKFNAARVEFDAVRTLKEKFLRTAFDRLRKGQARQDVAPAFEAFKGENAAWLEDAVLFQALTDDQKTNEWLKWEERYVMRDQLALDGFRQSHADDLEFHRFVQFVFFRQWAALKKFANSHGVNIVGDIPIFVALNSADVWANPHNFQLDEKNHPLVVAGVPPDYFSKTGQLWGNPLYDWDRMEKDGFQWWTARFGHAFKLFDRVRVDHFIGFYRYWAVPANDTTAMNGQWKRSKGAELFRELQNKFDTLPIIAEDLGVVSQEIIDLRDRFGFPGMKVALLGFMSDETDPNFIDKYTNEHAVIYTGTHDNNTTVGWYKSLEDGSKEKALVEKYVGLNVPEINWYFIKLIMESKPALSMVPLQDILGLGEEGRMNHPGTTGLKNWTWRFKWSDVSAQALTRFRSLTVSTGRAAK